MEKKQSSIEFYDEKSRDLIHMYVNGDIDVRELLTMRHNLFYDAEAMHKEESELLFECGRNFQLKGEGTFNEVYNETFGGNNE